MAARIWVGRFGISQGQALEMGPWQGAFTRQTPGEEPTHLYVLVHPALPGSEEFCGQIVAVIGHLFERQNLSLTGALLKAIKAANDNLRDWNQKSLREHRVGAGISCLAVRGNQAYLAQAGPAVAFQHCGGAFKRVEPLEETGKLVVGLGEELQPEMTRFELSPGDLVLVTSPLPQDGVDDGTIAEILAGDSEQALSEVYLLTRDLPDFSAFLLACYDEVEAVAEPAAPADEGEATPFDEDTLPAEAEVAVDGGEEAISFRRLEPAPVETVVPAPPTATADAARPGIRLRSSQPSMRGYSRPAGATRVPQIMPLWAFGAVVVLALAIVLAFCVLPGSDNDSDRFTRLLAEARETYAAALNLDSLSEKRVQFEKAQGLLEDAADIRPDDGELQALQLEVSRALAALDAVYEVADIQLVADLSTQITGEISLQRLVVGGDVAYFLDRKGGRLIALVLTGSGTIAEVVLSEGDLVGVVTAAKPALITWAPDADGGRLLLLDSERRLFALRPGEEPLPLSLRGTEGWESADAIAFDDGNLYVLDAEGGQVWRYVPTEAGFDSERTGVLSAVDLEGAIGLAVSGDIYLLMEDGRVRRFADGREVAFRLDGIDVEPMSPASLLPYDEDTLLVADRGNKRVVLFGLDGRFEMQLVSTHFTDLQAAAIDGVAGRIYFLDGDSLYVAGLPSPEGEAPPAAPTATPEEVAEPTAEPVEEVEPPAEEEALPTEEVPAEPPVEEPPPEEAPTLEPTPEPPTIEPPTPEPPTVEPTVATP